VLTENLHELMTEVSVPAPAAGTKMAWTKLKDRQVYDLAVVSVAVAFTLDGAGKWSDGRVMLGGVAPVPYRARLVETGFEGPGCQSHRQAGRGADPHRREADVAELVQSRHRAAPDRTDAAASSRLRRRQNPLSP
jgi:xanthine dehydrogenase YagS FAD-binding subunit